MSEKNILKEVPCIETDRLLLNGIGTDDIDDYNAIVLDKERNLMWGYDDVGALGTEPKRESFYEVVTTDFKNGDALNFAVREKGKTRLIGEAVLYDFDNRGCGELGCRIAAEYSGLGYGAEAYKAVIDWVKRSGYLRKIVGKCFKGNSSSRKMLEKTMTPCGEDDKYYYYYVEVE